MTPEQRRQAMMYGATSVPVLAGSPVGVLGIPAAPVSSGIPVLPAGNQPADEQYKKLYEINTGMPYDAPPVMAPAPQDTGYYPLTDAAKDLLAVAAEQPQVVPRREPVPTNNEYQKAMVAYYQAKKTQDPNWNPDTDPVYQDYKKNYELSLQKGYKWVRGDEGRPKPEVQPALINPPQGTPQSGMEPVAPVAYAAPPITAQINALPPQMMTTPPNTALYSLPCVDGNCGPQYTGQATPLGAPTNSILGNFVLAEILADGNRNVAAANATYDVLAQQRYMNDPLFAQNVQLGLQRGLNAQEATAAALAAGGYGAGDYNFANNQYFNTVLPGEARVAGTQQVLADEYGVPYTTQPGMFGGLTPHNGVWSILPGQEGASVYGVAGNVHGLQPGEAGQYSTLATSDDPIGYQRGIRRAADQRYLDDQQMRVSEEGKILDFQLADAQNRFSQALQGQVQLNPNDIQSVVSFISQLDPKAQGPAYRYISQAIQRANVTGTQLTNKQLLEEAKLAAQIADYESRVKLNEARTKTEENKANPADVILGTGNAGVTKFVGA